jgi:hypothetical protein
MPPPGAPRAPGNDVQATFAGAAALKPTCPPTWRTTPAGCHSRLASRITARRPTAGDAATCGGGRSSWGSVGTPARGRASSACSAPCRASSAPGRRPRRPAHGRVDGDGDAQAARGRPGGPPRRAESRLPAGPVARPHRHRAGAAEAPHDRPGGRRLAVVKVIDFGVGKAAGLPGRRDPLEIEIEDGRAWADYSEQLTSGVELLWYHRHLLVDAFRRDGGVQNLSR